MAPQAKLFQTIHTQGRLYSTAVHTTYGAIVKPPSPMTATHRPVGSGELRAEHAAHAEAHRRVAPAVEHALRPARLPELHEPVMVHAGVERQDHVVGQHFLQRADDEFRPQR